jgi:hypothetical protein
LEYREYYKEELTKHSYRELISYASWMNEKFGNFPMIVGGWAVYFYTKGLGSRDIDTVFLTRNLLHDTLKYYFSSHGYEEHGIFSKEYYKEIKTEKGTFRIYLDACSREDKNLFQSDLSKEIPWSVCFRDPEKIEIQHDVFVYMPKREVIFMLKAKAFLDREYRLKRADITEREYLTQKTWKDALDVDSLTKKEMDEKLINDIMKEYDFEDMFENLEGKVKVYI